MEMRKFLLKQTVEMEDADDNGKLSFDEFHNHMVGRCKLDPSLKATCFQTLNLRVHTVLST